MRHSNLKYLLPFLLPVACDAQATPDYQGEPLLTLTGILASQSTDPLPEADLVLAWPDFAKIDENGQVLSSTFARVQLSAQLPAHFTAQIFQAPPDSAYALEGTPGWTLLGPRSATAQILLARHDVTAITDTGFNWVDPAQNQLLANFDKYFLVYYESDGVPGFRGPDGTAYLGDPVTKGFHLGRVDRTACSMGPDATCLDVTMFVNGVITDDDRDRCVTLGGSATAVEIPLDTPLDLVIPGPPPPASTLPPCPASQD